LGGAAVAASALAVNQTHANRPSTRIGKILTAKTRILSLFLHDG
jgi:hypothetical protein